MMKRWKLMNVGEIAQFFSRYLYYLFPYMVLVFLAWFFAHICGTPPKLVFNLKVLKPLNCCFLSTTRRGRKGYTCNSSLFLAVCRLASRIKLTTTYLL